MYVTYIFIKHVDNSRVEMVSNLYPMHVCKVQGDNSSDRDLGAVQRGDAEMEQKMNRALRACLERASENPISSIHDQGAGGNGNLTIWPYVLILLVRKCSIYPSEGFWRKSEFVL